jgi:hypothetical protein
MSAAAAPVTGANLGKTWSLGPVKVQVFDVTLVSGNTTCAVTADRMATVLWAIFTPATAQTAAPTYSGSSATFTFTDPAATIYGQAIVFGI